MNLDVELVKNSKDKKFEHSSADGISPTKGMNVIYRLNLSMPMGQNAIPLRKMLNAVAQCTYNGLFY